MSESELLEKIFNMAKELEKPKKKTRAKRQYTPEERAAMEERLSTIRKKANENRRKKAAERREAKNGSKPAQEHVQEHIQEVVQPVQEPAPAPAPVPTPEVVKPAPVPVDLSHIENKIDQISKQKKKKKVPDTPFWNNDPLGLFN